MIILMRIFTVLLGFTVLLLVYRIAKRALKRRLRRPMVQDESLRFDMLTAGLPLEEGGTLPWTLTPNEIRAHPGFVQQASPRFECWRFTKVIVWGPWRIDDLHVLLSAPGSPYSDWIPERWSFSIKDLDQRCSPRQMREMLQILIADTFMPAADRPGLWTANAGWVDVEQRACLVLGKDFYLSVAKRAQDWGASIELLRMFRWRKLLEVHALAQSLTPDLQWRPPGPQKTDYPVWVFEKADPSAVIPTPLEDLAQERFTVWFDRKHALFGASLRTVSFCWAPEDWRGVSKVVEDVSDDHGGIIICTELRLHLQSAKVSIRFDDVFEGEESLERWIREIIGAH